MTLGPGLAADQSSSPKSRLQDFCLFMLAFGMGG